MNRQYIVYDVTCDLQLSTTYFWEKCNGIKPDQKGNHVFSVHELRILELACRDWGVKSVYKREVKKQDGEWIVVGSYETFWD
jgi:hypothetical protein